MVGTHHLISVPLFAFNFSHLLSSPAGCTSGIRLFPNCHVRELLCFAFLEQQQQLVCRPSLFVTCIYFLVILYSEEREVIYTHTHTHTHIAPCLSEHADAAAGSRESKP
jgi:hypothetical protein